MASKTPKNIVTLEKLTITWCNLNDIHPNDYNPNRQSDHDFELLCRSIEEDGFTQPILAHVDTNEIVDGEHRWRACKILAEKDPRFATIPVVFVNMTKEQMMISTLRHNRARGNENINLAADVLRDLQKLGALDQAADSLMLSEVEMKIMLEDIPEGKFQLRTPGEKMTIEQTLDTLQKEQKLEEQKAAEDSAQASKETKGLLSMVFSFNSAESLVLNRAFGHRPKAKDIVNLCLKYKDNPEAMAYLDQEGSLVEAAIGNE